MSLISQYKKDKTIQIVVIQSEYSELVLEHNLKKGDYVVSRLGDFHHEINSTGYVGIIEFGVCDIFSLEERFVQISEKQKNDLVKSILQNKSPEKYKDTVIDELNKKIEKLTNKSSKKED